MATVLGMVRGYVGVFGIRLIGMAGVIDGYGFGGRSLFLGFAQVAQGLIWLGLKSLNTLLFCKDALMQEYDGYGSRKGTLKTKYIKDARCPLCQSG